jgi:hypothetical protein
MRQIVRLVRCAWCVLKNGDHNMHFCVDGPGQCHLECRTCKLTFEV